MEPAFYWRRHVIKKVTEIRALITTRDEARGMGQRGSWGGTDPGGSEGSVTRLRNGS